MIEKIPYVKTELELLPVKSEVLQSGQLNDEVVRRLHSVIECEGPITRELLLKRVINSFDIYKVGWRVNEYFKTVLTGFEKYARDEEGVCVYHCENERQNCFRPDTKKFRFSHQIPPCEGANVIVKVLEDSSKRLKKDPVYYAFIAELGYKKSGSDLKELFRKSLKYALDSALVLKTRSCTYHI